MKLQFGYLNRDHQPATDVDLATLLGKYEHKPTEIAHEILSGPLAMAYRGDRITLEEDYETQPLQWGSYIVTFDGRLDNREQIAGTIPVTATVDIPDPLLIAKAYERVGDSLFRDLIGEFALSIWCSSTRTLALVRSLDGARTLYYKIEKTRLLWCTDFAHLVRATQADLTIDDEYTHGYLKSLPPSSRTALASIHAVPANTILRFKNDTFHKAEPLWSKTHIKRLRFKTDAEYEETCLALLKDAVRVRLRAKRPVFAELSGGLDSSSLVLLAKDLCASGSITRRVYTVSRLYEESQTCDERRFIRAVEDFQGESSFYVHESDESATLDLDEPAFTGLPNPLKCFSGIYAKYSSYMAKYQSQILMTGTGGDYLFWSARDATPLLAEELTQCSLRNFHRDCQAWSMETRSPYSQLLFRALRSAIPSGTGPRSEIRMHHFSSLFAQLSAGYFNEYHQLYVTHPYSHRPLLEFCLALPFSQLFRGTTTRSIQRRALHDTLPPTIVQRRSKASADETFIRLVKKQWPQIGDVHEWQICRRGMVSPRVLLRSLNDLRLGFNKASHFAIRAVSLESWLRSLRQAHKHDVARLHLTTA